MLLSDLRNIELVRKAFLALVLVCFTKANLETFIPTVNGMADEYVEGTGIFLCSSRLRNSELCTLRTQSGIIRTNCIDSLDRTNFMQQLIGVNVLGKQLYAVGLRDTPKLHVGTNPSLC